jgi:transcriptional regulator with XRE-family HTH domain
MKVRDPEHIKKLMEIQGVSLRDLSRSVGWKSHTYLIRILDGRIGSVQPKPAARMARRLGVGIDDLFVTRLSTDSTQSVKRRSAA